MPINKIQFQPGLPLPEFFARFGTEERFDAALEETRWPNGFVCPDCGEQRQVCRSLSRRIAISLQPSVRSAPHGPAPVGRPRPRTDLGPAREVAAVS